MTVEFVNDQDKWGYPADKDNHAWDVSVYGLWLADFFRLKYRDKPKQNKEKKQVQVKQPRVVKSNFIHG